MNNFQNNSEHMSVKDWIVTYLLLLIPVVNIVLMFVWAFDENTHECKRNYFKAQLIILAGAIVISIVIVIFALILGATAGSFLNSY
ncbi:MAG: hypothetical protein ABF289_05265 [Clostridiales bacterium]